MNIDSKIINTLLECGCTIKENEPMKLHTSFKIGGPAELFVSVYTAEQLAVLLRCVKENDIPFLMLGNGSNMLVKDSGIPGITARLEGDFCKIDTPDETTIRCGAGALLSSFCHAALENSLTGLEFAWGIPGSVGGAAFMNAGAYGGEMKDVVIECEYVTPDGDLGKLSNEECAFGYRDSIFQHKDLIVTAVTVRLEKGSHDEIKSAMDDILGRRKDKQPLELPSAGSVFKRPVGYFAGGLIEQCNLKGCTVGGAQVSEKHAGFIVNIGNATCEDVLNLVKHIQDTVLENTGVTLECEIRAIPYD